jgi:hypothetical protein
MGDYLGLAAAIGAPQILTEQVEDCTGDRQSSRTGRIVVSLSLFGRA